MSNFNDSLGYLSLCLKEVEGAREMVSLFSISGAFADDLSLVSPAPIVGSSQLPVCAALGDPVPALFWTSQALGTNIVHILVCRQNIRKQK